MVFLLFALTVIVFLGFDYFLHKEERALKETEAAMKSPIFLSPERSLKVLKADNTRLFHLSHSWIQQYDQEYYYAGYDNFIPSIFSMQFAIPYLSLALVFMLGELFCWFCGGTLCHAA